MSGNVNQANQVLTDHPKLAKTPGLAAPVLKSPNPAVAAPVISHSYDVTTTQQALSDHAAEGDNMNVWQKIFNGAGKVVMGGLNWLAKPLQEVQRDYKFIHSVYTRHGIFEGVLATAGIAGGMALGSFIGPEGTVAGGEIAATLERKLLGQSIWRDSYNDSENKNYKVSAGRDFANAISQIPGLGDLRNTDKGLGKIISGTGDAIFDFQADPFILALKARTAIQAGKFIVGGKTLTNKIPFRASAPGVQDLLERNSLQTFNSAEQLDKLYQSGNKPTVADRIMGGAGIKYQRALRDIAKVANEDGPGGIVAKFPQLRGLAEYIAPGRGATASVTAKDVHDVFVQSMWDEEFMKAWSVGGQSMVPSRTVLRSVLSKASDKLRQGNLDDELALRANQTNFFLPRYAKGAQFVDAIDPLTGQKIIDPNTGQAVQVISQNADKTWNLPVVFRPFSGNAWRSALAGKTRTFSGYLPYTIDSKTLELSNLKFDPHDPAAADVVYRVARFSMSDNMARQVTSDFLYGDIGQKRGIYAGMIHEMVKAAGLPNDSEFAASLMNKIGMLMHGPIDKVTYGWGRNSGRKASIVETPQGSTTQAAFEDQRGYFSIPDFREVKNAMRSVGAYGKLYGRIDDFAAKYTDNVFKPLALLTGGFGLRIAASELLPAVFRFGAIETAKNKISSSAARMNYKLAAGEDKHILENAIHAIANGTNPSVFLADAANAVGKKSVKKVIAKGLNKLASEDDLDLAARIAIATRGHMAVGATLTGHGIPAEQQEFMRQVVELMGADGKKQYLKPTGEFSHYTNSDSSFDLHYFSQLAKSATTNSRRTLVADALEALKSGKSYDEAWKIAEAKDLARIRGVEYNPTAPGGMGKPLPKGMDEYASERKILASYNNEDSAAFASRRSDIMSNLFIGGNGKVHMDLMEQVANGVKPSLEKLKSLGAIEKPAAVAGQRYDLTVGPNLLNRITNFGFGKVVDPIVNHLSREPLYFNHVKNEMRFLQGAVDKGYLSEEEATRIAMTRGAYSMVPQIHNTSLRTQFSVLARNFLPFYFAQEQAMRRAGALIASNPAAFRGYQLVEQGMNDPGFVHTDANGARNITLPVVGELGSGFLNAASMLGLPVIGGLPVTATGNLSSLKTVLPEIQMPGVSPFVSIALNTLGSFDPALDRSIKKMTGGAGFSTSLFDQLIPNAPARNIFKALNANEKESSFHNAIISAIAAANFHGQIPPPDVSPMVKQQFLDRIKNNARSILIMKALLGTISPLAPAVSQEDPGLRDEFYKMLKEKSAVTGNNMTYPEALGKFLAKHGDAAISYTVARTEATVRGANMPYTNNAINWIENNKNLIYGPHAVGAAFLIPQVTSADGDAQAIHDEVIKMHLRANKTPDDFLKSVYVAAGNNAIAKDKIIHDKAMEELDKAGLSKADERAAWGAYVQDFGKMNPIWWDDYSSTAKGHVAEVALNDLQVLFASKNPPTGRQANLVKGLLNDWHIHNMAITAYRDNRFSESVKTESDSWNNYLNDLSVSTPELNSVINSVFRRL